MLLFCHDIALCLWYSQVPLLVIGFTTSPCIRSFPILFPLSLLLPSHSRLRNLHAVLSVSNRCV